MNHISACILPRPALPTSMVVARHLLFVELSQFIFWHGIRWRLVCLPALFLAIFNPGQALQSFEIKLIGSLQTGSSWMLPLLTVVEQIRVPQASCHPSHPLRPFMTPQITLQRTISFPADLKPPVRLSPDSTMSSTKTGRRRRSSSIIYQEPPESLEQISDQSALPNLNSQWVNAKGG